MGFIIVLMSLGNTPDSAYAYSKKIELEFAKKQTLLSREELKKGLIQSNVFYEDMKQSLISQEELIRIRYEIISNISDWQQETGIIKI